jgi:hypothetical protein
VGVELDFSGEHRPKLANRHELLLGGILNLEEVLCIFVRLCELMIRLFGFLLLW